MNVFGPQGDKIDLQSWLFEGESFKEPQDFCGRAGENYSFCDGQGSFSPQAITSDEIPGWTDEHTDWYGNLNLDECLQMDVKKGSWYDNLTGDDAKFAAGVFDEYKKFMQDKRDSVGQKTEDSFSSIDQERRDSITSIESNDYDRFNIKSEELPLDSDFSNHMSMESNHVPMEDLDSSVSLPTVTGLIDNCENIYCEEAPHDSQMLDNDNLVYSDNFDYLLKENGPQIIKVPLSEAAIQPQIKVLNYEPHRVDQDIDHPKIIFCKRVTMPSPVTAPSLKDVITEKGDELLMDYVDEIRSEHSLMDGYENSFNSSYENGNSSHGAKTSGGRRKATFTLAERKERKKEQNKRAAIRYREKKKEEEGDIFGSIDDEQERNSQLKKEYAKLVSEKDIVRGLLLDLLKRKRAEIASF